MKSVFFPLLLAFFLPVKAAIFPDSIENVLKKAGENRIELEMVLKHYSLNEKDSLKYKSACYLITNMPGHYGVYHFNIKAGDAVFEKIEKTLLQGIDTAEWKKLINSPLKPSTEQTGYMKYDLDVIKAEFLIHSIDNAFYVWENYPWCAGMDFETFKKYILPYRIANEPLSNLMDYFQKRYAWLPGRMKNKSDMAEAFTIVYKDFRSRATGGWQYGRIKSVNDLIEMYAGSCYDECVFKCIMMRSLGIICSFDFIPHWANRSSDHTWNAYVKDEANPLIIDKDSLLRQHVYLNSAEFEIVSPGVKYLPEDITVTPAKKGTKAFRKSFRVNADHIVFKNPTREEIPNEFNDPFYVDVTKDYIRSFDIELPIPEEIQKAFAYVCVFDLGGLYPVDWGQITNNRVTFKSLGADVLYFATIYTNKSFTPFTLPFILAKDGSIHYLKPDENKRDIITVKRKYPFFGSILTYANLSVGAKFQGSNKENFSDAVDLYSINETPLIPKEVLISNSKKFRFLRYLPLNTSTGDLAELQFCTRENDKDIPLTGTQIFKYANPPTKSYVNAFDGNIETFYKSSSTGIWIGLDLGKGIKKRVSKINFCPRSDTNFIIPGKDYELFYWDDGWISIDRKIASDYFMKFDNVPSGALYWLHCHTGGKEERPFTWENARQVWW